GLHDMGHRVVMVGDGFNDAPALVEAWVGVSIGQAASDLARESADIILLGNHLGGFAQLMVLARRVRMRLWTNIIFSLVLKSLVLAATVAGHGSLWLAVLADVGASLVVIFVGLRLLREPLDP
ncbi:MAG TPA: hypothetical protein VIY86_00765, partial [Pirellulaceae bacterium]